MIDILLLLLGHALVWGLGVALLLCLPGRKPAPATDAAGGLRAPGEIAWTLGAGWFAGAFVLTLAMRGVDAAGVPFSRLSIAGPLLALSILFAVLALRRARGGRGFPAVGDAAAPSSAALPPGWQRWLWYALLAWLVLRFGLLLAESALRPLYAWDSWMQWATKARVWFALKTMAPFAPFETWLTGNGATYIDAAPHYPATIPLWQVWSALLIDRWDDSLTNFAWWATAVALSCVVYGHLRGTGASPLPALVAAWFVGSLPILDTHVALAGYADLPIAGYLTLAVLAALRWTRERNLRDLVLFALLLIALPTLKNPGKVWALLLLLTLLVALAPRQGLRVAGIAAGLGVLAVLVLAQTRPTILGYQLHLRGTFPGRGLLDAYFVYANWHLLALAVVAVALVGYRSLLRPGIAPITVTLAIGMGFLFFGFTFTNAYAWVEDQSTVNRATLHLAPLLVVWVMLVFGDWSGRMRVAPTVQDAGATGGSRPA
ncbi:MAG: hypothetical protein IPQ15_17425 [Betaproteobacteria bacterium]|nr:hypothetical protein [Betaproteobacteria bacterium]